VDLHDGFKRERRQTLVLALVLAVSVSVFAAPAAYSAVRSVKARLFNSKGQAIKTTSGAVNTKQQGDVGSRTKDSGGGAVEASPVSFTNAAIEPTGASSTGAIDVKTYAGGGSFLGAGDCTTAVGGADIGGGGQGLPNAVIVPGGTIITALLVNGTDGQVKVTSANPGLVGLPALQRYRVTAEMPNVTAAFGNGLAINDALTFTGVKSTDNGPGGDDVDGECNFVVLGQDL
jgi:hypothetical protein